MPLRLPERAQRAAMQISRRAAIRAERAATRRVFERTIDNESSRFAIYAHGAACHHCRSCFVARHTARAFYFARVMRVDDGAASARMRALYATMPVDGWQSPGLTRLPPRCC